MNTPTIDNRSREDVIKYIAEVAAHYTPEWRFDPDNPDAGSALALIYAAMFEETINRFNRIPYKNFLHFLKVLNVSLLPAEPSSGYVTLKVTEGYGEGTYLEKGVKLLAEGLSDERIMFETQSDIFVAPVHIACIYGSDGKSDVISCLYEKNGEECSQMHFFDSSAYPNCQSHVLYLSHQNVLYVGENSEITLSIQNTREDKVMQEYAAHLTGPQARWFYREGDLWRLFSAVQNQGGQIKLHRSCKGGQPEEPLTDDENKVLELSAQDGTEETVWMKCDFHNGAVLSNLQSDCILLSAKATGTIPDKVFANDMEQDLTEFFPFGEQFTILNDFYLCSDEVLSKKGAKITLELDSYYESLEQVAVETQDEDYQWKLIMRKAVVKKPDAVFTTADVVVWEYWNGMGWARLFMNYGYEHIFDAMDMGDKTRMIHFICPADIEKTVVNAHYGYMIRGRLIKVKNAYHPHGIYVAPCIYGVRFNYIYDGQGVLPEKVLTMNNMEWCDSTDKVRMNQDVVLLSGMDFGHNIVYIGLNKQPVGSPIKIHFHLSRHYSGGKPILKWEFYSGTRRDGGWTELKIIDNTDNLTKSGLVTFTGTTDFRANRLFNKELYWIRIVEENGSFEKRKGAILPPVLDSVRINTVDVIQNETMEQETFTLEPQTPNQICTLTAGNVSSVEVWVDELSALSDSELLKLRDDPETLTETLKEETGNMTGFLIQWTEVPDFLLSDCWDRHYSIDRHTGIVKFGDGIFGKIPPGTGENENVLIRYCTIKGEAGNVGPDRIKTLNATSGFISEIFNGEAVLGGCDRETIEEVLQRGTQILRHRDRAVTEKDFEALAFQASRNVLKARCLSNKNRKGRFQAGKVTVVILHREAGNQEQFEKEQELVMDYLAERVSGAVWKSGALSVVGPKFIELSLKVTVSVRDDHDAIAVRRDIISILRKYLDPVKGNFDGNGWEIGVLPDKMEMYSFIKNVRKVRSIDNIFVHARTLEETGYRELDFETFERLPLMMPISGNHEVVVQFSDDE